MPNPIVLAVHPDATVEYTRNSDFVPFDGEGTMERVTDIAKFKHASLYYINWLMGPYAGMAHSVSMATNYGVPIPPRPDNDNAPSAIITFPTYEAAVEHEVAVLNAMRKAGVRFHDSEETGT